MVPGFGKQRNVIGSAPSCDIRLGGAGVQPEHAAIVHEGGGKLVFMDGGVGPTAANGVQVAPGAAIPFDFRTQFHVG